MTPNVCILRTDGTNCDEETAHAVELAGGSPHLVHVNQLRERTKSLMEYAALMLPGGFSYGDDVASGVVQANELTSFLGDELRAFVESGRLVLGICNGFQVLVRTGLLPGIEGAKVSLTLNDSGRFECRWVDLVFGYDSSCVFAHGMVGRMMSLPVAHGEGKFVADEAVLHQLHELKLSPLTYNQGRPLTEYPGNPNGSLGGIAGISNPSGRVFGLMPHPERFVRKTQHPNWRRFDHQPSGLLIFQNAITYARDL